PTGQTDPTSLVVAVGDHQHLVTYPTVSLFGSDFVFTPVATSAESAAAFVFHTHTFDPSPSQVVFEGDSLVNFIEELSPPLRPVAVFLPSFTTPESDGHHHFIGQTFLDF